jgi:hypothetical protein
MEFSERLGEPFLSLGGECNILVYHRHWRLCLLRHVLPKFDLDGSGILVESHAELHSEAVITLNMPINRDNNAFCPSLNWYESL